MATHAFEWQSLASPTASSGTGSHTGSHHGPGASMQRALVDPYHGLYPSAPHMRTIELPETDSPMVGFVSPGYSSGSVSVSGSSRSRPVSFPNEGTGLGIYMYGLPSPPISPSSSGTGPAPEVHPLLRGNGNMLIAYNLLHAPDSRTLRTIQGARIGDSDLRQPATTPLRCTRLRVSVVLCPGGAGAGSNSPSHAPRRFFWDIDLIPSRRSSVPPPSQTSLTLGDTLLSLHRSFLLEVSDAELRQLALQPQELQYARSMLSARRRAYPHSPAGFIRADFAYGCTQLAGFVRTAENSFSLRLVPPPA